MKKPEYNIGDIVVIKNEFSFNPSIKAISILQVKAIHILQGADIFGNSVNNTIKYDLKGHNEVRIDESRLLPISKISELENQKDA